MSKTINQEYLNATLRMLDKIGEANLHHIKDTYPVQAANLEKLGALMNNKDFCKQFIACTDKQAAVQLFIDHGITMSEEDITKLVEQIRALSQKLTDNNGALAEEDLELVSSGASGLATAGGSIFSGIIFGAIGTFICPGLGTFIGGVLGAALGGVLVNYDEI